MQVEEVSSENDHFKPMTIRIVIETRQEFEELRIMSSTADGQCLAALYDLLENKKRGLG